MHHLNRHFVGLTRSALAGVTLLASTSCTGIGDGAGLGDGAEAWTRRTPTGISIVARGDAWALFDRDTTRGWQPGAGRVTVTLGLPIVRTSVDHGTAFDIAWQGIASPESMVEALKLAAQLAVGAQTQ